MTKTQSSPSLSTKPRFKTESEIIHLIIHLIDAKMESARKAEIESWELDRQAQRCLEESAKAKKPHEVGAYVNEARKHKQKADKLRVKARRLIEITLPKLKQKLAVMRTPQIPAVDNGDASVMR